MRHHLTYHWWIYILYAIVSCAVILTIHGNIITPKENEIVKISIAGSDINTNTMIEDSLEYLQQHSSQVIKQVSVEYIEPSNFEDALATRTLGGYDIIILPMSAVRENTGSFYFLPLDSFVEDNTISSERIYYEDSTAYGIFLHSDTITSMFSSYLEQSTNTTYVLFLNGYSVNLGSYSAYGNDTDTAAIEIVKYLMKGE